MRRRKPTWRVCGYPLKLNAKRTESGDATPSRGSHLAYIHDDVAKKTSAWRFVKLPALRIRIHEVSGCRRVEIDDDRLVPQGVRCARMKNLVFPGKICGAADIRKRRLRSADAVMLGPTNGCAQPFW